MQVTNETPRNEISIQGRTFSVPAPYSEGHPLTEGEASAMNQLLAENLRNNFAAQIKRWEEAKTKAQAEGKEFSDPEPSQSDLDAYVSDYEFGVRRAGTRVVVDPVEKEALGLAVAAVKDALAKKGLKVSDVGNDKIKELAAQAVEQYPQYRERAKQIVETRRAAASEDLGAGLLASLGEGQAAA